MEHSDTQPKEDKELELERYKTREAQILELLKATIAFEHAALKPLPLLNGGAIVAALTFAGQASDKLNLDVLLFAMVCWAFGLITSVVAIFHGYFSQFNFLKAARRRRDSDEARRVKVAFDTNVVSDFNEDAENARNYAQRCLAASLVAFIFGAISALLSLIVASA